MNNSNLKDIYIACGCFWGVEKFFQLQKGVVAVFSGYANGNRLNPTYEYVCSQRDKYIETVKITYDPAIISLGKLLRISLHIMNPIDGLISNDVGIQYQQAIFYVDNQSKEIVENFIEKIKTYKKIHDVKIIIGPLKIFYLAEDYHQKYLLKNPYGYCHLKAKVMKNYNE